MLRSARRIGRALGRLALATLAVVGARDAACDPLRARNLPEHARILMFMGQDSTTLSEYKAAVLDRDPAAPLPGGVTLYTTVVESQPPEPQPLDGLARRADWGGGVTFLDQTLKDYPQAALAIGLHLSDAAAGCSSLPLRAIAGDRAVDRATRDSYRRSIDAVIRKLRATNRAVFLRIGYEFDGPWNCYDAAAYIRAFQHIKTRIEQLDAANIATVWQSAGWPRDEKNPPHSSLTVSAADHLVSWYPGDDAVDWIALSTFYGGTYAAHQWSCSPPGQPSPYHTIAPRVAYDNVLAFARARRKPVMIAEAAPQGFSISARTASCIFARLERQISSQQLWDAWFEDWFDFVESNRDIVRAAAYINTHWDTQALWRCAPEAEIGTQACRAGYWGDSRLQADPYVLARFQARLRQGPYVQVRARD